MKAIKLKKSGVVFDQEHHTYTFNGVELQGVTSTLLRVVFPNRYADVPERVPKAAADRGTKIHQQVELSDSGCDVTAPEVVAYQATKKDFGLTTVANEYIVTDGVEFASPIDLVLRDEENNIILADVKTNYRLDEEYVSWQLSIYARFFEMQNCKHKVHSLLAIWLRDGKCVFKEVRRKTDEELDALFAAYHNHTALQPTNTQVALLTPDAVQLLLEVTAAYEEAKKVKDEITAGLLAAMEANGVKSWECDSLKATYIAPTESISFDSVAFKKEHPDEYAAYQKTTQKKSSIRLTIKN